MLSRLITLISLVALTIVMVMLNLTTPAEIGPLGVLVFFLMVYLVMLGICTIVIRVFRAMNRKGGMRRRDYLYGVVVAFGPIMVLLTQAFGSLNLFTIILTLVFVGLGCFLVYKRA